jgi:competence protein ComEA
MSVDAAAGRTFTQQGGVDPAALPEGDGKAILTRACSECHDLGSVVAKRLTPKQWKDVTKDMITRGVKAEDAEIAMLIEYLSINVGHVNVNRATEAELKTYGGFSAAEAAAILAARTKGQTFETLDDLKALPGIDVKTVDERKDRIAFK